jgi:predicted enzyme related to lactoylglutathione lyase
MPRCVVDQAATKRFYQEVFGLPGARRGRRISRVQLRKHAHQSAEGDGSVRPHRAPAEVGGPDARSRIQFTIDVDDVDAMCAYLAKRGVEL